jgi:hypothetical protein
LAGGFDGIGRLWIVLGMNDHRTSITVDGMTVHIDIERDEHGPRIVLSSTDCDLEGDCPGEYLMVPLAGHAAAS